MGYISAFKTCSAEVRRGVEWLMSNVDVDKDGAQYAEAFYVLEKFDQELVERYLERANDESFWKYWSIGEVDMRVVGVGWFLAKLGLHSNSFYMQELSNMKAGQSRDVRIEVLNMKSVNDVIDLTR